MDIDDLISKVLEGNTPEDVVDEITTTANLGQRYPKPMGRIRKKKNYIAGYPQPISATPPRSHREDFVESKTHQTKLRGMPYVRITFKQAGTTRKRTTWALKMPSKGPLVKYIALNKQGNELKDKSKGVVQKEIIIAKVGDVQEKPAGWNLHYGELEVLESLQIPTSYPTSVPGGGSFSALTAIHSRLPGIQTDHNNPWQRRIRRKKKQTNPSFNK